MKKLFLPVIFLFLLPAVHAQTLGWRANVFGFADNREYHSTVQIPQTIYGIQFAPELYLTFDSVHSLNIGMNALKEFGSLPQVDKMIPYLYYALNGKEFDFYFGVFPRNKFLGDSPKVIYYDSLQYYRPYISGLYWTYHKGNFNQSLYLDWTSRQTDTQRETFIMGTKGSYNYKMFFLKNHMYMYHRAGAGIPAEGEHLRDNGVAVVTMGLDASDHTFLDLLKFSISGIRSFERERHVTDWITPTGMIIDLDIEYKNFGINNTLYHGEGHHLDWGDPFYRLKQYDRLDMFYKILRSKRVAGSFTYSLHFAEGEISHQQQFHLTVNLSSDFKNRE